MSANGPDYGFGLYVHWPYCSRICPYCDFNVYAAKERDTDRLLEAILADLDAQRERLEAHPPLQSIFLGGGTPSLLSAHGLARILDAANDAFTFDQNIEITIESNPNDTSPEAVREWVDIGINRVSLGIQSLDDEALSFLGRDHSAKQARAALDLVQSQFDNHSIDLIYARPEQTPTAWEKELRQALALGAPHLSLYELTIEARTAFGKRTARGDLTPMADDDQADLYELTQAICADYQLNAYEVSNHARAPEFEARHNHIYWAGGDWIGIGPGAHGRLTRNGERFATEAHRKPADYIAAPGGSDTQLSTLDTAREYLAMALRPSRGMDLTRFQALFGQAVEPDILADLTENGLADLMDDRLVLTVRGRLMADFIAGQLSPY